MGRAGKITVASFSTIALICSALSIVTLVSLKSEGHPQFCIRAILARDLTLDIYVILLSMVGLAYACMPERTQKMIKQIYSSMLLVLGISVLVLGVLFVIILPHPYTSSLEDTPKWFRGGLVESTAWTSFTTCMKGNKFCEKRPLDIKDYSSKIDFKKNCCEAPVGCGNVTVQEPPVSGAKNEDCTKWRNNQNELCYGCNICKEQVVDMFKSSTFGFIPTAFFYAMVFMIGWFVLE